MPVSLYRLREDIGSVSEGLQPRARVGRLYCTRSAGMPARDHNIEGLHIF